MYVFSDSYKISFFVVLLLFFYLKNKKKKYIKCCLLIFKFGALRVRVFLMGSNTCFFQIYNIMYNSNCWTWKPELYLP